MKNEVLKYAIEGDFIKALLPDGSIEKGVVIKKHKRLALDEGNSNIHFLDGGFPDGTEFEFDSDDIDVDAEDEYQVDLELEGGDK